MLPLDIGIISTGSSKLSWTKSCAATFLTSLLTDLSADVPLKRPEEAGRNSELSRYVLSSALFNASSCPDRKRYRIRDSARNWA